MRIWKTTSINETPELELSNWRIFEVESKFWEGKTRHFCGYNLTETEGRVSSAIIEFDINAMIGKTKSGRVYKLVGDSGYNGDALYVWDYWYNRNEISSCKDVTTNYIFA